jgi:YfiH family protein
MGFVEKNGLRYFQFDIFQGQPLFHAVLTRRGGVSKPPFESLNTGGTVGDDPEAVLENHRIIYKIFGYDYASRFDVWQVHGTRILCTDVPRPPDQRHPQADGILTDKTGVTLFMRFADCVPILLMDPVRKVIGIIHAGWQGTHKQIARVAVKEMAAKYGSQPENLLAGIGPSICQDCYEVDRLVWDAFRESFGKDGEKYFIERNGRRYLDLWQANLDILEMAGVNQVETAGICTACHLEDWYSHRAEKGKTGRFAVFMSLGDN